MSPRKSDQDQWLADAARALAEAERLTGLLALTQPRHDLVLAALQADIMALRNEIDRLRRDRVREERRGFYPEWMEFSAWTPMR